jgi:hypothetical protein
MPGMTKQESEQMTQEQRAQARAQKYLNPYAAEQGEHLEGMISATQKAFDDENQSRVDQMRDQQAFEHEKEMERIKQDGLMKRLREASMQKAATQASPPPREDGSWSRTFNPSTHTWEYH